MLRLCSPRVSAPLGLAVSVDALLSSRVCMLPGYSGFQCDILFKDKISFSTSSDNEIQKDANALSVRQ